MQPANPYAPPTAKVSDAPNAEAAPPMWNPNAAASWSLLFSPIFGAFLHMKNWEALGDPAKAATSKAWVKGIVIYLLVIVLLGAFSASSQFIDALSRPLGLVLLLTWYFTIGKSQAQLVKEKFGNTYPRKGWGKPIGIAILLGIVFFIVAVALIFVASAMGIGPVK